MGESGFIRRRFSSWTRTSRPRISLNLTWISNGGSLLAEVTPVAALNIAQSTLTQDAEVFDVPALWPRAELALVRSGVYTVYTCLQKSSNRATLSPCACRKSWALPK